jgi:hypothetical protein
MQEVITAVAPARKGNSPDWYVNARDVIEPLLKTRRHAKVAMMIKYCDESKAEYK